MEMNEDVFTPEAFAGLDSEEGKKRRLAAGERETEKVLGRRMPSGKMRLKELKPVHMKIVAMHLQGMKGTKIAESFFAQGIKLSAASINSVLRDPLAKDVIERFREAYHEELLALGSLATDAVRDGLESGDKELRLKAVDRFVKLRGDHEGVKGVSVQVNILDARTNLVKVLTDVAGPLIEGAAELVEVDG